MIAQLRAVDPSIPAAGGVVDLNRVLALGTAQSLHVVVEKLFQGSVSSIWGVYSGV